tara:strand:+ start:4475 stop:4861 length:387 start_codon:yes stop_codon:yes gene_type:complete
VEFKKQESWRLSKDLKKGKYCFLIGANNWAVELQEKEFISLYELTYKLSNEFLILKDHLMDQELVNLELETINWYAELEGTKKNWSLRIVFESDDETRSFEMYWPIQIAETLCIEIKKMWESMQKKHK